jgi:hypothetical protein
MSKEYAELLAAAKLVAYNSWTAEFRKKSFDNLRAAIIAVEASQNQPWDGIDRRNTKEDALGFAVDDIPDSTGGRL